MTDPSAVTFYQHQAVYVQSHRLSSNQQLQTVFISGVSWGAWGQVGCGYRCPRCCGDVEEGVRSDVGGRRVAERGGGGDAGQVDAEGEPRLLQGLLRNGEGFQLLLTVGHVGVLAASTDAVQAGLSRREETNETRSLCRSHNKARL